MKKSLVLALLMWPILSFAQQRYVAGVRVMTAPPPVRVEVRSRAPSPRHQWVAGYWGWRGGRHVWLPGHWAMPPAPGYIWEPAVWRNEGGSWTFFEGHWRASEPVAPGYVYQPPAPPEQAMVVEAPPPQPLVEVRPALPFPGAIWIPGFWNWNGNRHVWVGGRYSARPAGYGWEENRWERRGDGHWVHRPGHWRPEHGHAEHERAEHERR
jgi:hypothetical protein